MFWRGVLGYLPVNIVQAVAGFGSIVLFTRLLSPQDYGVYALAFAVTSLVQTSVFVWIEAAMARFFAAETTAPGRADLFATLYRTFAVMTVAVPLIAAVILVLLPLAAPLKWSIGAGLASVIARSLLKLAQERRRAAGAVRGFAVIDIVQTSAAFLIGVALARLGWGGASPLAGVGAASLLCLVWALPSELAAARGGRFEPARLRAYAAYGLPISLSLMLALVLSTTDRFVLAAYLNEATVGAYHAGYSLSNRTLDIMFIWLGMAGGPAAVAALERGGVEAVQRVAREQASLMLAIALPAAAGLALVAQPLAGLMVGPALASGAARVTPWIALSALFAGLTTYYLHTAFTLSRRTRRLLMAMAVPALANVALTLLLIPRHGLDGAMWATTASYGLGMVAAYALGRGALALPVPWTTLGRAATATGAMTVAVANAPSPGGLGEVAIKAMLGVIVYAVAALALDVGGVRSLGLPKLSTFRAGRLA